VTILKAQSATTDVNARVSPGRHITYTLTVTNPAGAVTATNVAVTDLVPANTSYVSCAGGASCSQSSGTVTWIIGTMNGGTSVPLTMIVTVNSPAFDGDSIDNSATVSADNGQGGSYTSPSNIVSYPIVAAPIISAVKSAVPASGSTVNPGNTITYTVIVTNSGNANTSTAVLHDAIPAGTTYVAGSTTLNGNAVVELTPGVAPVAGNMKVFSCGGADRAGRRNTLCQSAPLQPSCTTNAATVTFQVTVNAGSPARSPTLPRPARRPRRR
jgi:uncharacterized repeat protein (TIGR01451 family)